jgi:hypothetical protein
MFLSGGTGVARTWPSQSSDSITYGGICLCSFNAAHHDAVVAHQKPGDKRIAFIDMAGRYDGPLHPNMEGSALISDKLASALKNHIYY